MVQLELIVLLAPYGCAYHACACTTEGIYLYYFSANFKTCLDLSIEGIGRR
ncbi:hypothetical protein M758_6G206900 [Ceratodon purpureus]|uniref:Uncharacterized protein n=1 Tax=Ceratodon purpureus TaxID=3225 RepID=A0A8T0HK69_CERPU|nr:hypothetical protein KC19_6G216100 [Ceratodon purpureus]KAG0614831.1 hypothetical protein M758_6G206900 [Ceratodon purpureus]